MCGICGVFNPSVPVRDEERRWLRQAQDLLRHRGPDGQKCLERLGGRCLLGHDRLAIIDLEGGAQPICNEDGTICVVCNGEVYNYIEIRERLIAKGHRFSTGSDCEVLVHLYEEKGTALLDELEGMYAFAILDEREERLFLARDRFGEKPLYWTSLANDRGVAFASELKALMPYPDLDRKLDWAAIAQFLAIRYVPAPRTHLRSVRKLMAGEALTVDATSGFRRWRYWVPEITVNGHKRPLSRDEAVQEVRRHLFQSVRLRLRSDVPVASFLSGGIDSSFIVCAIRELEPGARLSTFCGTFEDAQLDEAPYARLIADRIGSDHHEVRFSSQEVLGCFEALIDHYDEPFADASMFPTFAVCRAARRLCKVMLSGDGGDECFAGYRELFQYYGWNGLRRAPGVNRMAKLVRGCWKQYWRGIGGLTFLSHSDWELVYRDEESRCILELFNPEFRNEAAVGLDELRAAALHHARLPYPLSALESVNMKYLPEQILVKVDRASMCTSLECRTPFLDRSLVEFTRDLPERYHFERGLGKALLRRALPDWVPSEIRWREKRGFTPPLASWLRTTLRAPLEEALHDFPDSLGQAMSPELAMRLNREHQDGSDRSDQLFRWFVLSRCCRNTSGANNCSLSKNASAEVHVSASAAHSDTRRL